MITTRVDERKRILVIEAQGMISENDIDNAFVDLEKRYPGLSVRPRGGDGRRVGILNDWRNLEGWEKGARVLGTVIGRSMSDIVGKLAVVADDKWREEVPRLTDAMQGKEVRLFAVDQMDAALAWLEKKDS